MEDYDYVMMVDENGSPYLAHVDWGKARQSVRNAASSAKNAVKSAGNKSYKYYQKLKEGGKTLYFYSADELKAHYDNLRKQASGAANSVKTNARTAAAKVSAAANELGNRAAYTAFKARQTANNMRNEFANRANQASNAIKDKAGVDERERRDAAKKAADEAQTRYDNAQDRLDEAHELRTDAKRNGGAGLSRAEELVRGAAREREAARKDNEEKQKAYREAQAEYDATVLGKADRAGEAARGAYEGARDLAGKAGEAARGAIDSAQEGARKAVDASKSKFDRMKDDFAKKAGQAKEAAKNRTDKIKETADKAISNIKAASKDIEDAVSDIKEKIKYEAGGKYEEILPELEKTNEYARNKWYSAVDEYTSIKKQKSDAEDLYNWGMSELAKAKEKLDNTSPYSIEGIKAKKEYNSIVKAVNNAADDYALLSTLEKDAYKACEEASAHYAKANDIYSTVKDADDRSLLNVSRRAGEAAGEAVSGIREVWNKISSGKALTKKDREILNEYNRQNR